MNKIIFFIVNQFYVLYVGVSVASRMSVCSEQNKHARLYCR